jgi:hypothetical protein
VVVAGSRLPGSDGQQLHAAATLVAATAQECMEHVQLRHFLASISAAEAQGENIKGRAAGELQHRLDAIHSQALATVVTTLAQGLKAEVALMAQGAPCSAWLARLSQDGMLVLMQSLLSTGSDELGMLADLSLAVAWLNNVTLQLALQPDQNAWEPYTVDLSGTRRWPHVVVGVDRGTWDALPTALQECPSFGVVAFLFTQGVNEIQTQATALGNDSLQNTINRENWWVNGVREDKGSEQRRGSSPCF